MTLVLGKAKPYPSEMEKVAQDKIKTTIHEIKATIDERDEIVDDKIETIKSSVESVKIGFTSQIQQVNVSLVVMKYNEHLSYNLRRNLLKN